MTLMSTGKSRPDKTQHNYMGNTDFLNTAVGLSGVMLAECVQEVTRFDSQNHKNNITWGLLPISNIINNDTLQRGRLDQKPWEERKLTFYSPLNAALCASK